MRLSARVDYALRAAVELAATASGPGRGRPVTADQIAPAQEISLAEVIRVIDGPLAHVRGQRPEQLGYHGPAHALQEVWIALRASEREILELVSVADVAAG